jgi:Rrf2 family protein
LEVFMKLSRASTYALHAVAYLAAQKQPGQPIASHLVAQAQGIPERFLLKVLKPLVSARLLYSVKGPNGGYCLARPAGEVSLLDVIEGVDGPIRGQVPFTNEDGPVALDRKLESVCGQIADLVRAQLQKVRLSDLAAHAKNKSGRPERRTA